MEYPSQIIPQLLGITAIDTQVIISMGYLSGVVAKIYTILAGHKQSKFVNVTKTS